MAQARRGLQTFRRNSPGALQLMQPVDPEQVLLGPAVFRVARLYLSYKPSADMFASSTHHQLPRYYSKVALDVASAGVDAFQFDWQLEPSTYPNPPWTLIHAVLWKLRDDMVRGMMVVPDWPTAAWWPLFEYLCVKARHFSTPIYMSEEGALRPLQAWHTIIGIVDGRRDGGFAATMQVLDVDVETQLVRHA